MFRIGIVGAGAIGKSHKRVILNNENCTIAAICDIARNKAEELAEGTDADVYTDYKDMQENEQLDGVVLNLPHFLHKEATVYFLEHHIPTLIEKPMANSVEECDAMIEAAEKYNTPLGVGHVQRYFKCHKYMRDLIQRNELGKLCMITETRNVNYFSNRPEWFLDKKLAGGGILMNYGAHTLDKLLYMTGLSVEGVSANGSNFLTDDSVEATAQVLVRFTDGCSAALTYSGCHTPFEYETHFYFTDGAVKIESCRNLWVAKGANQFEQIDLSGEDDVIADQLVEFLKMIEGKPNNMATPAYSKQVIAALEEAYKNF